MVTVCHGLIMVTGHSWSRTMGLLMIATAATWLSGYHFFGGLSGCHLSGDWNHGMSHDFPRKYWEWKIIPTDEQKYFSEGSVYHQPDNIDVIFLLEPRIMVNHGWLPQTTFLVIGRGFDPKHLGGHPVSDSLAEKSSKHNMGKSSKNIKLIKTDHRKKKNMKMFSPWKSHEILVFGMICWCRQVDHNGLIEFQVEPWCQKNGLIPWFTDGFNCMVNDS